MLTETIVYSTRICGIENATPAKNLTAKARAKNAIKIAELPQNLLWQKRLEESNYD